MGTIDAVVSTRRLVRCAEVGYVLLIAGLGAVATSDPNHLRASTFVIAIVGSLPAFVAAVPVMFVAASTAWNVTGADHGGVMWPVTLTYTLVFALAAVGNVWGLRLFRLDRRRRRTPLRSTR